MMKITFSWQRIILLALLFFTTVSITTAQVKIGENPNTINDAALLELESSSKGFLPPRLTNDQRNAITNPPTGLLIYNTDEGCLQINKGVPATPDWICIGEAGVTVTIDCNTNGFSGTYTEGEALTTQTLSVTVTNTSFSQADINFNVANVTLSGVSGISVTGVSPASASLSTAGASQLVTYTLSGTPTSFGTLTAAVDIAGILTCNTSVTVISASDAVLAQIGNEGDDPDVNPSVVTVAQLNLITPALTGVTAGNETAYQAYIDANPNDFSNPATQAEVQAMITAVNANQTLLANIGTDADNGNNALTSGVTAADFNALPGVSGAIVANEAAYLAYIAANANAFSAPATTGEVQAMITQVNANQTLLANIGTDADNGNNALTAGVTAADFNALPGVSGAIVANEAAYLAYISANANAFSAPATAGEVQAMITQVNDNQTLLANIGTDASNGNNTNTNALTAAQLNALPNVSGAITANETAYKAAIAANEGPFSSPATEAEVQAMVTQVNLNATLLANIGTDADNGNNANTGALTAAELNALVGVSGALVANEAEYRAAIAANTGPFSSPATEAEVQAMVTQINANQTLLANIGTDASNGNNANTSAVSAADLNAIVGVSGALAANEAAYRAAIAANTGPFSSPATEAEVQAMVTQINANQTLLANIGIDASNGNNANTSTVSAADLNAIVGVSGATTGNEAAYRTAIAANEGPFSSPATEAEVQAMVTGVNNSQNILAQIGNEADDPDVVTSVVTVAELNTIIPALTGVNASFEAAYQNYIDANPNNFSSPATQPEVQAMINYVAANPPIPATITLGQNVDHFVASIYDQDYLPYTAPTGAAVTTTVAADGTNEATTIDVQGSITTSGVTVAIPVTATGSGTLPAYSSTITIPANLTEDGISRDLTLSWTSQAFTTSTTSISATLTAVGGNLNAKKLDLNGGIGNDNLGVLLGSFTYPYNNSGNSTTFEARIISGIPDREFGDGVHDFIYLPVTNTSTGETWLNNNLGASYANVNHPDFNPVQQATSSTDNKAYGSLYQWGRYSDGHELIDRNAGDPHSTSGTRTTLSSSDTPGHGDFIGGSDWRSPQNNSLWQGESGTNNPCPSGYRLPTEAELNAERLSWGGSNATGAFASPLKLPTAGYRDRTGGSLQFVGGNGSYWSSAVSGTDARGLGFGSAAPGMYTRNRAYGYSVRCLKD